MGTMRDNLTREECEAILLWAQQYDAALKEHNPELSIKGTPAADIPRLARAHIALLDECESLRCGWRPIETAPKDGKYILIASGGVLPDTVIWCNEVPEHFINGNRYLARPEGWFNVSRSRIQNPTHWMPLPDPPDVAKTHLPSTRR